MARRALSGKGLKSGKKIREIGIEYGAQVQEKISPGDPADYRNGAASQPLLQIMGGNIIHSDGNQRRGKFRKGESASSRLGHAADQGELDPCREIPFKAAQQSFP